MARKWHLDIDYPFQSFETHWSAESHRLLLALFKYLDSQVNPVLSVLPPGISPAAAAIVASLYFLPGMPEPSRPHSRIALYPGRNFVGPLKAFQFEAISLYRIVQKARAAGLGWSRPNPPLVKLGKEFKTAGPVHFHWIWRCERIWKVYDRVERQELKPKGTFRKIDLYEAAIEIIDSAELIDPRPNDPYDLLIYCPYYHSWDFGDPQHPSQRVLAALESFHANRKLVVVRSPYEYWARKLSDELHVEGIAFVTKITPNSSKGKLRFEIVDQCLNGVESKLLCDELAKLSFNATPEMRKLISDLRGKIKKLLVSLAPLSGDDSPHQISFDLKDFAKSLGLLEKEPLNTIIEKLCHWAESPEGDTKLNKLVELIDDGTEIWVTKEGDRKAVLDILAKTGKKNKVVIVDRWMRAVPLGDARKRILTRIDRESDLDWVSYLLPDDIVLMSTWEAMVRAPTIVKTWERSERWRANAKKFGVSSADTYQEEHDPILQFTDFLLTLRKRCADGSAPDNEVEAQWWDESDRKDSFSPTFVREDLISDHEGRPCREIHFEDGTGIFLRVGAEVQIFREDSKEQGVLPVEIERLKPGDVIILPKDSERGTVLDLLMENLERSETYKNDAKIVRLWKDTLSAEFQRFEGTLAEFLPVLKEKGGHADPVTVRSWIYGTIMAPLREDNTRALMTALNIQHPTLDEVVKSVGKLRTVSRVLGRFLSQWVRGARKSTALTRELISNLDDSGVDIEEILGAIELKHIKSISPESIQVAPHQIRKMFKIS